MAAADDVLERVRTLCVAFPDVEDQSFAGHTSPAYRVRGKIFVMVNEAQTAFTFKAAPGVQQALVQSHPERFFVPAYVGTKGWVGAHLEAEQDWQELAELVEDSYRLIAPRSLVAQLDHA